MRPAGEWDTGLATRLAHLRLADAAVVTVPGAACGDPAAPASHALTAAL